MNRWSMWGTGSQSASRRGWLVAAGAVIVGLGCGPVAETGTVVESDPVGEQSQACQGANLSGTNLSGTNLSGTNLAGTNLGGANLGGNNLSGTNLAGTNLAGTNLGGNNLAGNNLAGTNLAGSNLAGTNLAGSNLAGSNLAGSNLAGSNLAGSNLAGNNLAGSNLAGSNLAGANSGMNIHSLSGTTTGMLYSREDAWLPKTGQCIVMGIGSTAFAKLLGQQSANAKISVALGKLPWGFANTSGGATTLDAWEAVVWGDKTYCSFVMASPPGTAWSGVAGFIKSIFRWNAPTTQSMDISGIEASSPYDPTLNTTIITYTGMMDAAAKFRAGTITETAFVAGEFAFVSATTNNQTVMVDFASWVQDKNKNPIVLGNVETNSPPTYAESVYVALDEGNGAVSILIDDAARSATTMPSGMTRTYSDLDAAYTTWKNGQGPKPVPLRCGGALDLNYNNAEPLPYGKCDSGLTWLAGECLSGSQKWSTVTGQTTGPNSYMQTTQANGAFSRTRKVNNTCSTTKKVLSETYVHMWTKSYNLNRAYQGTASSMGTIVLAPAQAFDNKLSSSGGTAWSVAEGPTVSAPQSLAYKFKTGASYAINSYSITSAGDNPDRDPRDWQLQGCGTSCSVGVDSGWTTLDTRSGQWFSNRWQTNTYSFPNSTPYAQIRLRITGTASMGGWKATASSEAGSDVAVQALDDDSTTRWSTGMDQAAGQYFQVDMLTAQTFSQIAMETGTLDDHPRNYQVFVSNDGLSWGSAIASGSGQSGTTTVTFPSQTSRYLRVALTGSSSHWWSIREFNVGGSLPLSTSGWVPSASASAGSYGPSNAIDNDSDASTRWATGTNQAAGQWFTVDMRTAQSFSQVTMNSKLDYPLGYELFVSNDGSNWGSAIAGGIGSSVTTATFPMKTARYLRIKNTAPMASTWWSIYNLAVRRDPALPRAPNYVQLGELQLFDSGSCTPPTDAALCASAGKNCGSVTAVDSCGATRNVASCGTCTSPASCAGGGVANVCGSGSSVACYTAYAQSKCSTYSPGSLISSGGHNWTCKSLNCNNCATDARFVPGGTGGQWGPAWQDDGPCQ